jgi:hypothetical protein
MRIPTENPRFGLAHDLLCPRDHGLDLAFQPIEPGRFNPSEERFTPSVISAENRLACATIRPVMPSIFV